MHEQIMGSTARKGVVLQRGQNQRSPRSQFSIGPFISRG
jgi:hypothetical protein